MTLRAINRVTLALVVAALGSACAPGFDGPNHLGVLPPTPPSPLWMGAVRPAGTSSIRGAAAVTLIPTPNYSHVLVSISGGVPGQSYAWTLHSGSCGNVGAAIPMSAYPLVAFADGTAKAEGYAPEKLAPGTPYAVVIGSSGTSSSTAAPPACADLAYSSM